MDNIIDIDIIKKGLPTITSTYGAFIHEAAIYCLEKFEHKTGVKALIRGNKHDTHCFFKWKTILDPKAQTSWGDEVTEYAAVGLAILISLKISKFQTVERSFKGTGIDYWLGNQDDDLVFQRKARLEISGIKHGNQTQINYRKNIKIKQSQQSANTNLEAHIIIIEFSLPEAKYDII